MYHMKTATVRDLRYDFPRIEQMLAQGEEVQITKRGKVIGKVVPAKQERPALPDFLGRIRATYRDEMLPTTGAEIVRMDRDRY
jgi:antitoxin (DNA-binding transcriptional repressor) of toxin-antitoxin stability system